MQLISRESDYNSFPLMLQNKKVIFDAWANVPGSTLALSNEWFTSTYTYKSRHFEAPCKQTFK